MGLDKTWDIPDLHQLEGKNTTTKMNVIHAPTQ
jgi:hypothetical protein